MKLCTPIWFFSSFTMAQYTVLACAGILCTLTGYYLGGWWLEENKETALDLSPSPSVAKRSSSERASLRGPQELIAGRVLYQQCLATVLSTCTIVCVCVWIFARGRRERERRDRQREEDLVRNEWQQRLEELQRFLDEKRQRITQHINDLRSIANDVDKFHKGATIANLTGTTASACGGILAIVGLAIAPVTLGASLIVSAVGAGVAAGGGLAKITAGVAEAKSNSNDKRKVEVTLRSCVEDLDAMCEVMDAEEQYMLAQVNDLLQQHRIQRGFEEMRTRFFNVREMGINSSQTDISMIIKDIIKSLGLVIATLLDDIIRTAVAGAAQAGARTAAGAAAKVSGILGAVFLPLDLYEMGKNSKHIHEGAESDMAARIREIAGRIENLIAPAPEGNMLAGTERRN